MKKTIIAIIILLSTVSHAGEIKIKDLEIGAPIETYRFISDCRPQKNGDVNCLTTAPSTTVGGEWIRDLLVIFDNGNTIGSIYFEFDPQSFDMMKKAILLKYKKIRCTQSVISNAMGAKFANEKCTLKLDKETIAFEKYNGSLNNGSLFLTTNERVLKSMAERLSKESDI